MEAFDTHDLYKEFEKAGVPPAHSEVFLKVIKADKAEREGILEKISEISKDRITEEQRKSLATKADIENLRTETKADIENLRTITKSEIALLSGVIQAEFKAIRAEMLAFHNENKVLISDAKISMLKWGIGLLITFSGVMLGLIKLMILQ